MTQAARSRIVIAPGVPHPAVLFPHTLAPPKHGGAFLSATAVTTQTAFAAADDAIAVNSPHMVGVFAQRARDTFWYSK